MGLIEAKTHIRFIEHTNERDHIYFKYGEGCSAEEVGREVKLFRADGGQLEITIDPSWVNAGVVAHEVCHALGMFHEHCRQDRTRYVNIDWDNIKEEWKPQYEKYDSSTGKDIGRYDFESIMHYPSSGSPAIDPSKAIIRLNNLSRVKGYSGDPKKMGQRSYLTDTDVSAINGLPRGILHINRIQVDGSIGMRTDTRDWSDGWTNSLTYTIGTQPFLFILKKLTGIVHVHKLTSEVGEQIDNRDWSDNWTSIDAITIGGRTFLLLLKVSDGSIHIHELNSNGTIGVQTDTKNWTSGYSTGKFFTVGGNAFLFILKKGDGIVKIHKFSSAGKIGTKVDDRNWSSGWSSVSFPQVGSETFLVLLKEEDGEIHVHRMLNDGKVGPQTDQKNWTSGYTQLTTYRVGSNTYLLFLKRSDGTVKIHSLDATGKISTVHREYNWQSGWGSIATYTYGGESFLVLLRERY
jgi:hypothetical protein